MAISKRRMYSVNSAFSLALTFSVILPFAGILALTAATWKVYGASIKDLSTSQFTLYASAAGGSIIITLSIVLFLLRLRYVLRKEVENISFLTHEALDSYAALEPTALAIHDDLYPLIPLINSIIEQAPMKKNDVNDTQSVQNQIERLLHDVTEIASGNFEIQSAVTPDALGVLADSLNFMVENLSKFIALAQSNSHQIIQQASKIQERVGNMTHSVQNQSQQINSVNDQLQSLGAFILEFNKFAQLSLASTEQAREEAESGRSYVENTLRKMEDIRTNVLNTSQKIKRLGERTQDISNVVRSIEDLADRTNVLALNAAIQLGVVGNENARGLTLFSDEIRILAEKASESTKKISGLVKNIQNETNEVTRYMEESVGLVESGSQLAQSSNQSIEKLEQTISELSTAVESLASKSDENTRFSELAAMTMGSAMTISANIYHVYSDIVSSFNVLYQFAEQLRISISKFKIRSEYQIRGTADSHPAFNRQQQQQQSHPSRPFPGGVKVTPHPPAWNQNSAPVAPPPYPQQALPPASRQNQGTGDPFAQTGFMQRNPQNPTGAYPSVPYRQQSRPIPNQQQYPTNPGQQNQTQQKIQQMWDDENQNDISEPNDPNATN